MSLTILSRGSHHPLRRPGFVLACLMAIACCSAPSSASAAGYSTFWYQPGPGCGYRGVSKTYYESGSASSWVSARGDFYYGAGSSWYSLGPQLTDYQSGGGAREARVAMDVVSTNPNLVNGTHRGSPWGSATNFSSATKPGYGCG